MCDPPAKTGRTSENSPNGDSQDLPEVDSQDVY